MDGTVVDTSKGWLLNALIILLSAHTLLEFLSHLGFLPDPVEEYLEKKRQKRAKELIDHTIASMGLTQLTEHVKVGRTVSEVLNFAESEVIDDLGPLLDEIVAKSIEKGQFLIGSNTKQPVHYFVNLRKIFCQNHGEQDRQMANIMIQFVKEKFLLNQLTCDFVVARKEGLVLLAYLVAKAMGKPLLLHSETPSVWDKPTTQPKFFDYSVAKDSKAILVDDSCVGGTSFQTIASDLKAKGVHLEHVFVLFCRKECAAEAFLTKHKLQLHSIRQYDDITLAPMIMKSQSKLGHNTEHERSIS